jgi:hypothetical protein
LTSLNAGTATEIFDLLENSPGDLLVTCIHHDVDTLHFNASQASAKHLADRITFLQADLKGGSLASGTIALGPQHLIYGLGICDYLNDDEVHVLLDWAYNLLAPGGWLILNNRAVGNPDRAFTVHILDWPVMHRTQDAFTQLVAGSRFAAPARDVARADDGVNLVARCRKS